MKGVIYTFINKINKKEYVGQTIQKIEKRDYGHYYEAFNQNLEGKFNNALRKYGKGGFIRNILHEVEKDNAEDLIDELNELEDKEILKRNSIKNGYNTLKGGRNKANKNGKNISEAKMNQVYKNSNIIEQYDLNGKLLNTFKSTMQAQRETGCNNGHILKVCNGIRKTHKGFIWKFGHIKSGELPEHLEGKDTAV